MPELVRAGLLRFAFLSVLLALGSVAVCDDKPKLGSHEDWNDIDKVEIKALFRLADYSVIKVVPFDTKDTPLPKKDDNTYEPVVQALESFNDRLLARMKDELEVKVERAGSETAPAADAPKALIIRGKVAKMWPGSAAARFFGGFGAGRSLIEVDCEVVDEQTGKVLLVVNHAKTSGASESLGYSRLLEKITEDLGEELSDMLERFE